MDRVPFQASWNEGRGIEGEGWRGKEGRNGSLSLGNSRGGASGQTGNSSGGWDAESQRGGLTPPQNARWSWKSERGSRPGPHGHAKSVNRRERDVVVRDVADWRKTAARERPVHVLTGEGIMTVNLVVRGGDGWGVSGGDSIRMILDVVARVGERGVRRGDGSRERE